MKETPKDIVLYVRVSTIEQNAETQLMALRDYCQRMNYRITREYIDSGYSGKDDKRPAFEELLADVRSDKVRCIIVYKLDRIGRSLRHVLALFEEFKHKGIEFIATTQNINTTTPEGKMFFQLLGVFGEYERELIVSRTLAGLQRAKKQGKQLGRPVGKKDGRPRKKSGYFVRWAGASK
jgi:DNA invertase Pin-like site-specific DNA recombinase